MNSNLLQLARQLGAIWRQLGLNQKVSVVLAGVAVLGGLGGLAFWSNQVPYELLYGKLDDAEASRVAAALDEAKIPYRPGPGTIYVPSDRKHQVRMQLAARGIPKGDGVGFEVFDKPNFGISDFVQRANYLRAVQGELSRTISQLEEVETAKVMVVMPENRLLLDKQRHPTASVFVKTRTRTALPGQAVNAIRFLVANSVEGLRPNYVSVVDSSGNVLSENSDNDPVTGLSNSQLKARRELEQYLGKQAEELLIPVLGAGRVVVRVAADIDFTTVNQVHEKFDPEGSGVIERSSVKTTEDNDSNTPTTVGVTGVAANSSTETNTAATPSTRMKTTRITENKENEISKVTSNITQVAGRVRRISAGVFVAAKTEGTGADLKVIPRPAEEIDKLKKIVQSAIGIQAGQDSDRKDEITLVEMPFNDVTASEISKHLEKQERTQMWTEIVRQLAYPGLALAVLGVFLRSVKRTPIEHIPLGVPVGPGEPGSMGDRGRSSGGRAGARGNSPLTGEESMEELRAEPVTVESLNRMIRDNPDNMTVAIRGWLSKGNTVSK